MNTSADDVHSHRIHELDGWRAISVLLVVLAHFLCNRCPDLLSPIPGLSNALSQAGALGPRFFFVISGFVICRLLILEEKRYGSVSLKGFYYRRAFRILPPLLTYLATVALLIPAGLIHETWKAIATSCAFLFDRNSAPSSWFVGHTWSLSVEEQFYLLFPSLWVLVPARWRNRAAIAAFLFSILLVLVFLAPPFNRGLELRSRIGFAAISLGVWLAINEAKVRRTVAHIPGFVICLVGLILLATLYREQVNLGTVLLRGIYTPPAVALILMYSLERGKLLRAFLCCRPMQAIGITSYGIYLWQELFTATPQRYTGRGAFLGYLLPLLCVVIPLSYFFIEKPAMRMGRSLSQRARRSCGTPAVIETPAISGPS